MQLSSLASLLSLAALTVAAPSHMIQRQDTTYNLQACINYNFEGQCTELQGTYGTCTDIPANFNDAISSVAGDKHTSCFAFREEGCTGEYFQIATNAQIPLVPVDMNNAISSILC
jgi:hypothetical protein